MNLSGVRWSARRECDEGICNVKIGIAEMGCLGIFTAGEIEAAASNGTADMGISHTQIAMFIMRQRLIRVLPLCRQCVCYAVRQAAQLREQQGENQQKSGEQGATHAVHSNQKA